MSSEPINVLWVMEQAADQIESHTEPCFRDCELRQARVTVSELLLAANRLANETPSIRVTSALDPVQDMNLRRLRAAILAAGGVR